MATKKLTKAELEAGVGTIPYIIETRKVGAKFAEVDRYLDEQIAKWRVQRLGQEGHFGEYVRVRYGGHIIWSAGVQR